MQKYSSIVVALILLMISSLTIAQESNVANNKKSNEYQPRKIRIYDTSVSEKANNYFLLQYPNPEKSTPYVISDFEITGKQSTKIWATEPFNYQTSQSIRITGYTISSKYIYLYGYISGPVKFADNIFFPSHLTDAFISAISKESGNVKWTSILSGVSLENTTTGKVIIESLRLVDDQLHATVNSDAGLELLNVSGNRIKIINRSTQNYNNVRLIYSPENGLTISEEAAY